MKKHITLSILCIFLSTIVLGQTQLQGKVTDTTNGEPVLFGTVALYKGGVLLSGTETDLDGNYFFSDIDPGNYDVEVSYIGLQTQRITGVVVKEGKVTPLNFLMTEESQILDEVVVVGYKVPLIEIDNTTSGSTLTAENIQALPTKAISAIAATTAGVSVDQGGNISIRGSRNDATFYYIDGVRVNATNAANLLPQAEIEQLQVITGGIEARYGDVIGGVISLTTKGPSAKYSGGIEAETSEFLDAFGYNLINANVSGPIIKRTLDDGSQQSVLGFRLFGQYRSIEEDNPSAVGVFRAPEELIRRLEENPISYIDGTPFPSAQFLTAEDIGDPIAARPNQRDRDFNFSAKLDARISDNIDLTVSGTYFDSKNRFDSGGRAVAFLNWVNNPFSLRDGYRGNVRFRHKLGRQGASSDDESISLIRNASYSIQFGYERGRTSQEDFQHGQNLFNYGYYGVQERDFVPTLSVLNNPDWEGEIFPCGPGGFMQCAFQGLTEVEGEFIRDDVINRTLSAPDFNDRNGFREQVQSNVFNLFTNVGNVHNVISKTEEDRYTLNVNSGFDLFPGGTSSSKHSIQFGFTYEQRVLRDWSINPRSIWELMRSTANRHLQNGVNIDEVIGEFIDPVTGQVAQLYAPNNQADEFPDSKFFREVRNLPGVDASIIDFINIDAIDPSELDLSLFSPLELIQENNLNLNYTGYDYLGRTKVPTSTTFDDFFGETDENGRRTFNVAPFNPNYIAGFIQDKFTFKDIIFRLGVRLDYYDANTQVLKDPFSFTEIESADQFFARNTDQTRPESIQGDYKVYVTEDGGDNIVGYRQGDQWFTPSGTATEGNLLFGGGLVFPSFLEQDELRRSPQFFDRTVDENGNVTVDRFDPSIAFEDYDPQLNVMPRLAFSFPINDDAGFFAHYDILVQRPNPGSSAATPLDYLFFENSGRFSPAQNPDLRPERTIDYEVGFQQKISSSSAIKISAYYKELRDLIQRRTFTFVPVISSYETFSNIDFGTIRGLAFNYDLRRTKNFQLNVTYALQFANGTGSGANSAAGINQNRNIRSLLPLSNDERHSLTVIGDYRFGSGQGPSLGGINFLENFGANLLINAISGRPYTTFNTVNTPTGAAIIEAINETRLPWVFRADLQLDKTFNFSLSEESKRKLFVNVYLRVQNLFDLDNIVNVYPFTQSPDDSGWLSTGLGEAALSSAVRNGFTEENYLSAFAWRILAPDNYAPPRQIFLGAIVNF